MQSSVFYAKGPVNAWRGSGSNLATNVRALLEGIAWWIKERREDTHAQTQAFVLRLSSSLLCDSSMRR